MNYTYHHGAFMKSNMPVTKIEHALNDKATLLSTTDKQSHITYANSAFIDASGFNEQQLMGEPHNIIRHPDMPAEAFGDMWFTLQQGETWTGLVKNRRQNGDHYWVRANVTPVWQDGNLTAGRWRRLPRFARLRSDTGPVPWQSSKAPRRRARTPLPEWWSWCRRRCRRRRPYC